jgi:hypothetical protein
MSTATLCSDITAEADALQLLMDTLGGRVVAEVPEPSWRGFTDQEALQDRLAAELTAVPASDLTNW